MKCSLSTLSSAPPPLFCLTWWEFDSILAKKKSFFPLLKLLVKHQFCLCHFSAGYASTTVTVVINEFEFCQTLSGSSVSAVNICWFSFFGWCERKLIIAAFGLWQAIYRRQWTLGNFSWRVSQFSDKKIKIQLFKLVSLQLSEYPTHKLRGAVISVFILTEHPRQEL